MGAYITGGGRHPCLPPTVEPCAADCYYQELFPNEELGGCNFSAHSSTCRFSDKVDVERGIVSD